MPKMPGIGNVRTFGRVNLLVGRRETGANGSRRLRPEGRKIMSRDLTRYATAEPTPTMEAFADFLIAEVFGGELPDGIEEVAFRTGVALGGSTRNYFQASDAWKSDPRNYLANVEANRAAKAEAALDRAKAAAAKAKAREAAALAKLEAAVEAAKAKAAALAAASEKAAAEGKSAPTKLNVADRFYTAARSRPLLLVHLLEAKAPAEIPAIRSGSCLVAVGLAFPKLADSSVREVKYKINLVKARELLFTEPGDDEDFNEEEM